MRINRVMRALKNRGHVLGSTEISWEGKTLLNVDGRLLTIPEADDLLEKGKENHGLAESS